MNKSPHTAGTRLSNSSAVTFTATTDLQLAPAGAPRPDLGNRHRGAGLTTT